MDPLGEEEGELVETGTFKVSREHMLEKLSRFQLRDPRHFVLALARAAEAAGAKELWIEEAAFGLSKGFQAGWRGAPLAAEDINDLFSQVISGGGGQARYLGAAALATLRTAPESLVVSTDEAAVRVRALLQSEPAPPIYGKGTGFRVRWPLPSEDYSVDEFTDILAVNLRLNSVSVRHPDGVLPPEALNESHPSRLAFSVGGRRGWVARPENAGDSVLELSVLGVKAGTAALRLPLVQVSGVVRDDALSLDLSMEACARDEKLDELAAFLGKQAEALLLREIALQREFFAAIGPLLEEDVQAGFWRAALGGAGLREEGTGGLLDAARRFLSKPAESGAAILRYGDAARRTLWLREACLSVLREPTAAEHLRAALRAAPLLFSAGGTPLSLADIGTLRAGGGLRVIRSSGNSRSGQPDTVWLASASDEAFLKAFVPESGWTLVR